MLTLAAGLYGGEFNIYPSIGFLISGGDPISGIFVVFVVRIFK